MEIEEAYQIKMNRESSAELMLWLLLVTHCRKKGGEFTNTVCSQKQTCTSSEIEKLTLGIRSLLFLFQESIECWCGWFIYFQTGSYHWRWNSKSCRETYWNEEGKDALVYVCLPGCTLTCVSYSLVEIDQRIYQVQSKFWGKILSHGLEKEF